MNILAIDQGTSSTKAVVLDGAARALAESTVPVATRTTDDGGVEQDPAEILASVRRAGREAIAAAGVPVGAVGLANQGETVLAWNAASHAPLGPAISWQDRRAADITAAMADEAGWLLELTGLPLDPYFAAPKMRWLADRVHDPGARVTTLDAWLVASLTGEAVTDVTTASRTMLLDLATGAWAPAACAAFGIDPSHLPRIAANAEVVGTTDAFGPPVPVSGLAVDQQAALFGERCLAAGDAKCTYGTGAFLLLHAGNRPPRSASGLAASVAYGDGATLTYCLDGPVHTAGAAISWLVRLGLLPEAAQLDTVAQAPPGALAFVPGLAGLGAPFWAPRAHGGWVGLSLGTSAGQLVGAVVEGIAAHVALLAQGAAADTGVPLRGLRVDGGLTASTVMMQTQADLLQLPLEVYPGGDATVLGVGAMARLGAGGAAGPHDALAPWTPAARYEPAVSADEAATRMERFRRAADALVRLSEHGG